MKLKIYTLLILGLLISSAAYTQVLIDPSNEVAGRNSGFLIGGFFSNRGLGGGFEFLLKDQDSHQWLVGIRAMGIHSLRESKITPSSQACPPAGPKYVFGKANRLMVVSPYIAWHKKIKKAASGNPLSLTILGQAGPSLALLRPYLIDVFEITSFSTCEVKPTKFNPSLHRYSDIVGASAGIGNSWTSLTIKPGIGAGLAVRLNLNDKAAYGSSLELGLRADYFLDKIAIMTEGQTQNLFISVQVGFLWGMIN